MGLPAPAPARESKNATGAAPAAGANPFTKAARRRTEPFYDVSGIALGSSSKTLQQIDIPATGFLRHLWLLVEVDGTATGGATLAADAPWNVIDSITLRDVNGQPLHVLSGYELFLANLFGAYSQHADPRKAYGYAATAAGGLKFALRVPVEIIARGALGCLANTNSSQTYKLQIALAPRDEVFTGAADNPTVRIRGIVESWSNPAPTDLRGVPNVTQPPALGVTQNWSTEVKPVVTGANTLRLSRVGNAIRNLIFVLRDNTGARVDAWPDELSIFIDGFQWQKALVDYHRQRTIELYGYAPADVPAGVLVFPYTDDFDGTPGEEVGDFWVQTSGATRLEVHGTFPAGAGGGSFGVLTNDVLAVAAPGGPGATLGAQA